MIDMSYLLVQSAILVGLAFVPLFLISAISPRRRWLIPLVLVCAVVGWAVVFSSVVAEVGRYLPAEPPYKPFRVGPSAFGVWDGIPRLALTFWGPVLVTYVAIHVVARRRNLKIRSALVIVAIVSSSVLGTALAWWSSLEDTFATPAFSWGPWQAIHQGMTREEVHQLLGPPLPDAFQPSFARDQGAECWVSNLSVGYFAAVWFDGDRVRRTRFWYSD